MSVTGTVRDGVIVLPAGTKLEEGAQVRVEMPELSEPQKVDFDLGEALSKLIKPRPHLPADYALNHGYYVKGEPKN